MVRIEIAPRRQIGCSREPVPPGLVQSLVADGPYLAPELAAKFNPQGHTWHEVFGDNANEAFMAWRYATFIDGVAEAGKHEYELPVYMNAQLPAPLERAGEYPSGGPHPGNVDIYRAVATHIDFYSPDIYWPDFEYWVGRYHLHGNPMFIPEARLESGPYNALYAYGAAKAFGFCPFAIDSLHASEKPDQSSPAMEQVYAALASLGDRLPEAQASGHTRAMVLHANSPRPAQTVVLGGYVFQGSLSRAWGTGTLESNDGAALFIQIAPDEFLVIGSGLTVKFSRDPDTDDKVAGIASIDEVEADGSGWKIVQHMNGDQSNQGRQLTLNAHDFKIYRVLLYSALR